jgi:hypothetical protein
VVPTSDNPVVHEDLAETALQVPIEDAAEWAKRETGWLSKQRWLSFRLPEKLVALAGRLAEAGKVPIALGLIRDLFKPLPDPQHAKAKQEGREPLFPPRPVARFDAYDYSRELAAAVRVVVDDTGLRGLRVLADLLESAIQLSLDSPAPPTDYSFIWIDDLSESSDPDNTIRESLTIAVRDAAVGLASRLGCTEVLGVLDEKPWDLFRRLKLHLLRVGCADERERVRTLLLNREAFDYAPTRHEYVLLLRDAFEWFDENEKQLILGWIDAGPDREAMRQRHVRFTGEEPTSELVQGWVEQWQRDRLSPLKEVLPKHRREQFEALVRKHGKPQFDTVSMSTSVRWGEVSPVTADDLRRMSRDELRQYLRDWVPPEGIDAPTRAGVVQELRCMGDDFFTQESSTAASWADLHPTYTAAFLSELEKLVRKGLRIDWPPVVDLCARTIASQALDDESRWLVQQSVDLLKSGFDAGTAGPDIALRDRLWHALKGLHARKDLDRGDSRLEGDSVDYLALAINSLRGRAAEAVIRYAVWIKRHDAADDPSWRLQEQLPEVAALLDKLADPSVERSTNTRAIFGVQLAPLMWLDASWVEERIPMLFPEAERDTQLKAAVWDTFLVYGRPFGQALELLRDQYIRAVTELADHTPANRNQKEVEQHLAEHVLTYAWQGFATLERDGLVDLFFRNARLDVRRWGIDFVGRSLHNSGEVPPEPLAILVELLDSILAGALGQRSPGEELIGFGWWFASGKFSDDLAIDRLVRVLRITGRVEPDHMVAEKLVELVDRFPLRVAEAVRRMVEGIREPYELASWRDEAKAILTRLRENPEQPVRAEVTRAINALVLRRYTEFRELRPS